MAKNKTDPAGKLPISEQLVQRLRLMLVGSIIIIMVSCAAPVVSPPQPEPYGSFYAQVANRVSALTEWHVQNDMDAQGRLDRLLPTLAQSHSVVDMRRRLRHERILRPLLNDMTAFLEQELLRPRNKLVRERRNDPRIAREIVAALLKGMEEGLTRLRLKQPTNDPA